MTDDLSHVIIWRNKIMKTVEAEIKTKHALTESPECWEPDRKQFVKWTAEGAVKSSVVCWVFCNVRHTLVVGNMIVFRRVCDKKVFFYCKTRWHHGKRYPPLTMLLSWAVFLLHFMQRLKRKSPTCCRVLPVTAHTELAVEGIN